MAPESVSTATPASSRSCPFRSVPASGSRGGPQLRSAPSDDDCPCPRHGAGVRPADRVQVDRRHRVRLGAVPRHSRFDHRQCGHPRTRSRAAHRERRMGRAGLHPQPRCVDSDVGLAGRSVRDQAHVPDRADGVHRRVVAVWLRTNDRPADRLSCHPGRRRRNVDPGWSGHAVPGFSSGRAGPGGDGDHGSDAGCPGSWPGHRRLDRRPTSVGAGSSSSTCPFGMVALWFGWRHLREHTHPASGRFDVAGLHPVGRRRWR